MIDLLISKCIQCVTVSKLLRPIAKMISKISFKPTFSHILLRIAFNKLTLLLLNAFPFNRVTITNMLTMS